MNKVTNVGLIIATIILAAGLMFAAGKDAPAWLFTFISGIIIFKTGVMREAEDDDDDDDEDDE